MFYPGVSVTRFDLYQHHGLFAAYEYGIRMLLQMNSMHTFLFPP